MAVVLQQQLSRRTKMVWKWMTKAMKQKQEQGQMRGKGPSAKWCCVCKGDRWWGADGCLWAPGMMYVEFSSTLPRWKCTDAAVLQMS